MIQTLLSQVKEFKKASLLTPVFVILEVIMEVIIPLLMASIIDNGVEAGNINHVYVMGGCMIAMAMLSLLFGTLYGKYAARASTGFARNLRRAVFGNIQGFWSKTDAQPAGNNLTFCASRSALLFKALPVLNCDIHKTGL